ncbi:MAG: hypothetical protein WDZ62_00940 [Candidatus Pacearchaeota archaeon]
MKWHAITGSWRNTSKKIERDVIKAVENIVLLGEGIVTGGALGVDYIATKTVLKDINQRPVVDNLKIFLPTSLENYSRHYFKRAREGIITETQANKLVNQLEKVYEVNPNAIIEGPKNVEVDKRSYYARIEKIVMASNDVFAFHVNNSKGVQYGIDFAEKSGKPVFIKKYNLKNPLKKVKIRC